MSSLTSTVQERYLNNISIEFAVVFTYLNDNAIKREIVLNSKGDYITIISLRECGC